MSICKVRLDIITITLVYATKRVDHASRGGSHASSSASEATTVDVFVLLQAMLVFTSLISDNVVATTVDQSTAAQRKAALEEENTQN